MAIYDNLPVFKDTYDLLLLFIRQSNHLQRDSRPIGFVIRLIEY